MINNYSTLVEYLNNFTDTHQITLIGPLNPQPSDWKEPCVFVDGGTKFRTNTQFGFAVGDGDSAPLPLDQFLSPDKDFSDLQYVLANIPQHFQKINLWGFMGGRLDHQLMNFSEVHLFLKNRENCVVYFDSNILAYSKGCWNFSFNGTFSLFCFEPTNVNLNGDCYYPLDQLPLRHLSSHGLSNQANGKVLLENDHPVFLFLNT